MARVEKELEEIRAERAKAYNKQELKDLRMSMSKEHHHQQAYSSSI